MKKQNGITLIALIITIVVLLILAVVAIGAVQDSGIIGHAQNAGEDYTEEQEKEKISVALSEWAIQKYTQGGITFAEYMQGKIEGATVTANENGTITVAFKNNTYEVTEDGQITKTEGISIIAEGFPLKIEEGEDMPTGTLKAQLIDIEGEITWSIENDSIATISAEQGEEITVTAVAKGETKVTATCEEDSAEYIVKVTQKVALAKGVFVKYDVTYTDAYRGYEYTTTNGWRLIDYTENADGTYSNVKIMSTGIPARLDYKRSDTTNNSWWATEEETLTNFREVLGGDNYTFYTGDKTYYSLQASAGMYYKFEKINFAYGVGKRGDNLGYFKSITSNGTTYDVNNTTAKTGGDLFNLYGDNAKVRLLTLPEINNALGRTDIDDTSSFDDSTGLYELESISTAGIGLDSNAYTTSGDDYWVASPFPSTSSNYYGCYVNSTGSMRYSYGNSNAGISVCGVRPVVCLSSNVQLEDTNGDGAFEIKF